MKNDRKKRPRVAFIVQTMPGYKAWVLEALDKKFDGSVVLVHGNEMEGTLPADVGHQINIRENVVLKNVYPKLKNKHAVWIPCVRWLLKDRPDVILLADEVKILSNYAVLAIARWRRRPVIFYGHGFNHQASLGSQPWLSKLVERFRLFYLRRASAVVVYDEAGREYLLRNAVACPIYVSYNTIDTKPGLEFYESHGTREQKETLRSMESIDADAFVVTFLGRLVAGKKLDFYFEVVTQLQARMPGKVVGLVIGDGPERDSFEGFMGYGTIRFAGFQTGDALRRLLVISDVVFLPGMVGLAIVEAFCAGLPLITVNHDYHGPEISYLKHMENGLLLPGFDLTEAVEAISRLANDQALLNRLGQNAMRTAREECNPSRTIDAFLEAFNR